MELKDTEKVGAEPTDKTVVAGAEPVKDAKSDPSTDVPWNKDPRFQEFLKEKKGLTAANDRLQNLLKANELDDPDDLADLVARGKAVKGKISDLTQIDEIIQKAQKLERYEAYWKNQEELKRRGQEEPDQTIARLDKELRAKHDSDRQREEQRTQAESAKRAVQSFESDVQGYVKEMDIPKDQQGFVLEFFGVGNPANDIDITDKKAIKKLINDGIKKKESYDQAVIAAYLSKKTEIPKVASGVGTATETTKVKIMLKDARKMFREQMQTASGG
jgi:hypothetical protein